MLRNLQEIEGRHLYLKKLEMKGFKSFADKTEIDFQSGISCIVGPNGSGKSNITDAVRWVLGEQKVKTLRGTKMEDIIFNGTARRKPYGMAEVSLIFDNRDRFFPIDFQELKITRRAYRSGENEYLINNAMCRLKEVKELIMDTGVGTDGYSIIGQGRIDSILSQNKEERRMVFEEAAGIVKYGSKKKETERKIEALDLNLLRIEDILHELNGRINPLRAEKETAEVYLKHTSELKNIEITMFLNQSSELKEKLKSVLVSLEEVLKRLEADEAIYGELDQSYEELASIIEQLKERMQTNNRQALEMMAKMKELEGEQALAEEKLRRIHSELQRYERESADLAAEKLTLEEAIARENEVCEKLFSESETEEKESDEMQLAVQTFEEEVNGAKKKSEEDRGEMIRLFNAIENGKRDVVSLEVATSSFEERLGYLDEQRSLLDADAVSEAEKQGLIEKRLSEVTLARDTSLLQQEQLENRQIELVKEKKASQEGLQRHIQERGKLQTEGQLLKELENSYEGYDFAVKHALAFAQQSGLKKQVHGVVANILDIPERFEVAIEAVLGKQLQHIVVENERDAKGMIDELKARNKGRATFLPLSLIQSNRGNDRTNRLKTHAGYLGTGNDLIGCDSRYAGILHYLLGRTLFVENYETAVKVLKEADPGFRVVTLAGEVMTTSGAITGGSIKATSTGILSRKRRMTEIEEQLVRLEQQINTYTNQLELYEKEEKDAYNALKLIKETLVLHEDEKRRLELELYDLESSVKNREFQRERYQNEALAVTQEIESNKKRLTELETEMDQLLQRKDQLELMVSENQQRVVEMERTLNEKREAQMVKRSGLAAYKERLINGQNELRRLEAHYSGFDERFNHTQAARDQLNIDRKAIVEKKGELLEALATLYNSHERAESDHIAIKRSIDESEVDLHALRQKRESVIERMKVDKEASHKLEVQKTRHEVEFESITAALHEKYELDLESAEPFRLDVIPKEAVKHVKQLREAIKALGDVNVGAIEAYQEVSERLTFMTEQHTDIIKSKKTLLDIMESLDHKMKMQFNETFESIRVHFKDIFSTLFNGGVADLALEDPTNALESAIEIEAQPPGKKLQNLNLMSGGEKALTAIALVFAIMRIKPAPFCILDEIEAALDDVNVDRFSEFVSQFTGQSQFVIITHRKGTMEAADVLFGVTMEEYGVSKILSLKLEDAESYV